MANGTKTPQDEDYYNRTQELYNRELNVGKRDQDDEFERQYGGDNYKKDSETSGSNILAKKAKEQEENPTKEGLYNPNSDSYYGGKRSKKGRNLSRANIRAIVRKRGPLGLLITMILGGGVAGFTLLSPALAPIAFFANIGELDDQLSAMTIGHTHLFRNKIPRASTSDVLKGCKVLSMRCKFATLSDTEVKKLKYAKVTVNAQSEPAGLLNNRVVPESYTFQGKDYTPDAWAQAAKTDPAVAAAQYKANNVKFVGLRDNAFIHSVLERFGVSLKPPELKGKPQDRVNALLDHTGTSDASKLTFTENKDGTWSLDGDTNVDANGKPRTYTTAQKNSMQASIDRVVNAKPPSKVTKASIGALSVLGYWDLACSINNMLGAASVAAKVANQVELVKYGMPIASLAGSMKAGDISPEDAEALGTFFTQTDDRKMIPDIANSIETSGAAYAVKDTVAMKPNPNYGKNGMDSSLYQLSTTGTVPSPSPERAAYSLGMGQNQLLSGIANFAAISSALVNIGSGKVACNVVQNGAVRLVGIIATVGLGVVSFGTETIGQLAVAGSMMAGMAILNTVINNALGGTAINTANLADAPVDRADAEWTSMSAIYGASAQGHGLIPGNAAQLTQYQSLQNQTQQKVAAIESRDANPLDIYNQYSFLGSLAQSVMSYTSSSSSIMSSLSNVASIVTGSFGSLLKQSTAYAAPVDQARFKQCDDKGYTDIGIDADVQCNVRYYMPSSDLNMDVDDVAVYMEDNGYVEKDTTTGLPAGYTVPNMTQSQSATMDLINGTVNSFFDTRNYGNTPQAAEYGKYLDYCVYRTMPYGETYQEDGALNDVGDDWKSGKKCMEQSTELSNFRMYTLYKSLQQGDDDEVDSTGPSSFGTSAAGSTIDQAHVFDDSVNIACAPGTTDAGVAQGYHSGKEINIRLCSIPNTHIPGYGGTPAQVNSRVSGAFLALINKLIASPANHGKSTLTIADSFRTYAQQQQVYNKYGYPHADYPGYSNHEMGLAVDFQLGSNTGATRPGDPVYDWLVANAGTYGIKKLPTEAWHWQAIGAG